MTELTLARIKGIQLFLFAVVAVLLLFGGCGEQESKESAGLEHMEVSLSGGVDINTMGTEAWKETQNSDGAGTLSGTGNLNGTGSPGDTEEFNYSGNVTELKMDFNPNEAEVIYQGTAFMSTCRTIGGDSIYSAGFLGEFDGSHPAEGPYFAGRIGMEEDTIQQFPLEIPEDMLVYRGCIDDQGRWHVLLAQEKGDIVTGQRETEIWVIDREGKLEQSFDITECVKEGGWFCYWMAVDKEGLYYFATNQSIRIIDVTDQTVETLHFSGMITGIGIGRSGALYGVFDVEGNELLGIVDTGDGKIVKCAELPENKARPTFSVLQAGVNTELFLANMGDGIWSYDGAELTQELTLENIVANGQDILAMGFLWDGRVCIMSYEDGHYAFRYAPVEG